MVARGLYKNMSHLSIDLTRDELVNWLADFGASADDILENEDGRKFIMVEYENGNPEEDGYSAGFRPQFLPREFQEIL